jgi:type IV fimbrial biogenesis protein FimT
MTRSRGFTLTEMMVVILIIGVLGILAFPAMTRMLTTQAVRSSAYDLFADLIYARSEAITRGTTVTVQAASGTTDWKQGWTVRENAGGTTLRSQSASGSAISFTANQNAITFERTGRAQNAAEVQFAILPNDTDTNAVQVHQKRCIKLDPSGRPRSMEGACV